MDMQELYERFCATELGYKASFEYFLVWLEGFAGLEFDYRYVCDDEARGVSCGAFNSQELIFAIDSAYDKFWQQEAD